MSAQVPDATTSGTTTASTEPSVTLERVTDEAPDYRQGIADAFAKLGTPEAPSTATAAAPAPAPQPAPTATPEPAVTAPPPETTPPPPAVEELPPAHARLAAVFENATAADAVERTQQALTDLRAWDPVVAQNLAQAVYENNRAGLIPWALTELGVPQEKVQEFIGWVKSGAQPLPTFEPQFPEPDANGYVYVDGVQLDMNDPHDKLQYNTAKQLYEAKIEKQRADAQIAKQNADQKAAADKLAAETKANAEQQRVSEYFQNHVAMAGAVLDGLKFEAPEEDQADIIYTIMGHLNNSPELKAINDKYLPYVRAGAGRAQDAALEAKRVIDKMARSVVDRYNRRALRENQLERAAASTAPVLPPGTQTITAATPPPPDSQPAQTWDEMKARTMPNVKAALANLPRH